MMKQSRSTSNQLTNLSKLLGSYFNQDAVYEYSGSAAAVDAFAREFPLDTVQLAYLELMGLRVECEEGKWQDSELGVLLGLLGSCYYPNHGKYRMWVHQLFITLGESIGERMRREGK